MSSTNKPPYLGKVYSSSGKYKNKKVEIDGVTFDSKKEAKRYGELKLLERINEINDLELQPKFPIVVNGKKIATYIADFRYRTSDGSTVVEDVKGVRTPVYRIKKKLVEALESISIVEID